MVLDTALLNTQQYKGKVEQSRERSSAFPYTPQCGSYWKGSLLVALDYGRQQLLFYLNINSHDGGRVSLWDKLGI